MSGTTAGTLLGGRIRYRQFTAGHRSGFEPVLLAAAVKARPGETVLEAGTGAGAALLCLAARVPGVIGTGVEIDAELAALANENFKINGLLDFSAINANIMAHEFGPVFDHAMANPPWHEAASTASPDAKRALAHQAGPDLLEHWITALGKMVKPKGSITLIIPAARFGQTVSALKSVGCGGILLLPLWPRAGEPAKLVIVSARRGSKSPDGVLPGLVLHDAAGITPAANAVLRDGAAL
jgi:tRNA1(Val) A37 N6-methylase TrmN6